MIRSNSLGLKFLVFENRLYREIFYFYLIVLCLLYRKPSDTAHGVPEDTTWCISDIFHLLCQKVVNF